MLASSRITSVLLIASTFSLFFLYSTEAAQAQVDSKNQDVSKPPPTVKPIELNITVEMLKDDSRLSQAVTVRRPRIRVGDLLDELSKQTGVRILAGERDGAADPLLSVFCKDIPLHKLLNSLWSLMSYREGNWNWGRESIDGQYVYRFTQPNSARRFGQMLSNWVQIQFEANAEKLMAAADASDEVRKRTLKDIYGREDVGDATLPPDRIWADVRAFKHLLSPTQQKQVLRGELSFEAPLEKLDPNSRNFLLQAWHKETDSPSRLIVNGVEQPNTRQPDPKALKFFRSKMMNSPALLVYMANTDNTSAFQIGGVPLERSYREKIRKAWMLDSDSDDDPAMDVSMKRPQKESELLMTGNPDAAGGRAWPTEHDRLVKRLEDISLGAGVPVVARLSDVQSGFAGLKEPWNVTLREFWKQLWQVSLMVKWHDGVQLVSTDAWPMIEPPLPLFIIRALRERIKPGELTPWDTLLDMADAMTPGQLKQLQREYPVAEAALQYQPLLTLLKQRRQLLDAAMTPQGAPLTPPLIEALRKCFPNSLLERIDNGRAKRLTLVIDEREQNGTKWREAQFMLHDQDGKGLGGQGIIEKSRPKPEKAP